MRLFPDCPNARQFGERLGVQYRTAYDIWTKLKITGGKLT